MNLKKTFFYTSIFLISSSNAFSQTAKDNFNNTNKGSNEWRYFLNGKDVSYLPDIELDGSIKYIPVDIVRNLGAILTTDFQNKTVYLTNNDESFVLKNGVKEIYPNNPYNKLQEAPIWKNNTMYVPTNFLLKLNILVAQNKFQNEINIIKTFNNITEVRSNFDSVEGKITLNLDSLPNFETSSGKDFYKVSLLGTGIKEFDKIKKQLENISSEFKKVEVENAKQGIINLTFYPKGNFENTNVYYLDKPSRLVIQFPKLYRNEVKEFVKQGLNISKIAESDYQGPNKINVLEINPKSNILIKPMVYREGNNFNLKEISKFSKDYNAIAGINGGYFSLKTLFPQGLVVLNNTLLSTPIYNRTALLFKKDGTFDMKNIDMNIFLKATDSQGVVKQIKINAFNQLPQKNQIVMFTYNYGKDNLNKKKPTNPKDDEMEIIEDQEYSGYILSTTGDKLEKLDDFSGELPSGKFVVYASGKGKEDLEKLQATTVSYQLDFNYSDNLGSAIHALGGGPRLIKDSKISITSQEEKFKADITEGRAPRTAMAVLKNGKVLLVTVDGRRPELSKGLTLEELANFLKDYSAKDAMNFDGGGSTAMYLNGSLINTVSDPKERKVSTGIFLFDK